MNPQRSRILAVALTLALATPVVAQAAQAADQVRVAHAWIRVLPSALPAGGYATLDNTGAVAVKLVAADSRAYGRVMLHESTVNGGVSRMHRIRQLVVPAHGSVTLKPGGYHLMLMHAQHTVKPGQRISIRLHFADGSTRRVDFLARPANARSDTD